MIKKIITDTGCDLNKELLDNENVERAPFVLELGETSVVDTLDLDVKKYLTDMEKFKGAPKSAAPSPEYFYDIFKSSDQSFAVTISSKLSGSYNSAISAKNMIVDEMKDKLIHIFDSKTACAGQTLIVLKLNELLEKGLEFDSIVEKMTEFIEQTKTYFIILSFDNLVKAGRVKPYIASIAKLLSITAIGTASDGEIDVCDKVRGQKKAFIKLSEIVANSEIDFSDRILSITHVEAPEVAEEFKNLIISKVNFKDIVIQEASGLCTNYAQRGGIVIAY